MEKKVDIETEQEQTAVTAADLNETADAMERLADQEERAADAIATGMDIKDEDHPKIRQTVHDFISNYAHKDAETTDEQFLVKQFNKYPGLWRDQEEISQIANDIVEAVYSYEKNRREIENHIAQGKRRESWLARKIEQGAAAAGAAQVSMYAQGIDNAITCANEAMARTIRNIDGSINQNPNLDGLIAEQHHASTFNIDAATKEKNFHAEPLQSNGKNSVDIVIRDERGEIVRKYQSKYGKDAETTEDYFKNGDYRGQRKLVPEGQGDKIKGANEKIDFKDYKSKKPETVESKPLSKEEAKAKQDQAQREGKVDDYTWNDANKGVIARKIGGKAALAAAFAIGLQGARIVGRRICNWATGKENKSVAEDVKEFAESAVKSGASAGITVAASGALTVAARSGWLGKLLMKTPAGHLAAAACVGIENVKVLYKYGKGELTGEEALDQAGRATTSTIGALALGAKGASVGAAIGAALGPVGAAIGGLAGGMIGGMAGSVVGEVAFSAGRKIVTKAVDVVRNTAKGAAKGFAKMGNAIMAGGKAFLAKLFG